MMLQLIIFLVVTVVLLFRNVFFYLNVITWFYPISTLLIWKHCWKKTNLWLPVIFTIIACEPYAFVSSKRLILRRYSLLKLVETSIWMTMSTDTLNWQLSCSRIVEVVTYYAQVYMLNIYGRVYLSCSNSLFFNFPFFFKFWSITVYSLFSAIS